MRALFDNTDEAVDILLPVGAQLVTTKEDRSLLVCFPVYRIGSQEAEVECPGTRILCYNQTLFRCIILWETDTGFAEITQEERGK